MVIKIEDMKRTAYMIIAILAAVVFSACQKTDTIDSPVIGDWHLVNWMSESQEDFDVYISFMNDGSFRMYQKVESSAFVEYTGTFTVTASEISGTYSDGLPWSSSYSYSLSEDNSVLTMTSKTPNAEVSVYERSEIPSEVFDSPLLKSSEECSRRFL